MTRVTFGNGYEKVVVDAPAGLAYHLVNYLSGEPEAEQQAEAIWSITVEVDPGLDICVTGCHYVTGEYGEPLLVSNRSNEIFNLINRTRIVLSLPERTLSIVGATESGVFMESYRAVRQILVRGLLGRGALVIHGSAIAEADNGAVTVFVGGKGAGKTTSVWQALQTYPGVFAYMANERILIVPDGRRVRVFGWPATALVGLGTVDATVGLAALVDMHDRAGATARLLTGHRLTDAAVARAFARAGITRDLARYKVDVTPGEVSALTQAPLLSWGYLARIVMPSYATAPDHVYPCESKDAERVLRAETLDLRDSYADWLGLGGTWRSWPEDSSGILRPEVELLTVTGNNLAMWYRPQGEGVSLRIADSLLRCSAVSSTSAALTFSARCLIESVPGMGITTGEICSNQARASWLTVQLACSAIVIRSPDARTILPAPSGDQAMNAKPSLVQYSSTSFDRRSIRLKRFCTLTIGAMSRASTSRGSSTCDSPILAIFPSRRIAFSSPS